MNLLTFLLGLQKKKERKTLSDEGQEVRINAGREQFEKLQDLGLKIPVRIT